MKELFLVAILLCVGAIAQESEWSKRSKFQIRQLNHMSPLNEAQAIGAQGAYRTQARVISGTVQTKNISSLLDGGVRRFQLDAYVDPSNDVYMCNLEVPYTGSGRDDCTAFSPLLGDFLDEMIAWLDEQTTYNDYIHIQISQQFTAGFVQGDADTVDSLFGDKFGDLLFRPADKTEATYPTARSLIEARDSHVVLVSNGAAASDGTNVFQHLAEPYATSWIADGHFNEFNGSTCVSSSAPGPYNFPAVWEDTKVVGAYNGPQEVGIIYKRTSDSLLNNIPDVQNCGFTAMMMDINDAQLQEFIWNFREDEPTYDTSANCAVVTTDGSWEMRSCSESHPVACYASGAGWSLSSGSARFSAAGDACDTGEFQAPKNAGDNYRIVEAMNSTGEDAVWINYNDIADENCFSIDGLAASCPENRLVAPKKGSGDSYTPIGEVVGPIAFILLCCCCCCLVCVCVLIIASIVTVILVKIFYIDKIDSDYVGTG